MGTTRNTIKLHKNLQDLETENTPHNSAGMLWYHRALWTAAHTVDVFGPHDIVPGHLFVYLSPHRETEIEEQRIYERGAQH